jgi:hypothetical protein
MISKDSLKNDRHGTSYRMTFHLLLVPEYMLERGTSLCLMYLVGGTRGSESSMDQIAKILQLPDNKTRNGNFHLWDREVRLLESFGVYRIQYIATHIHTTYCTSYSQLEGNMSMTARHPVFVCAGLQLRSSVESIPSRYAG